MKLKEIFQIAIYLMIIVVILADIFKWSQNTINILFDWIVALLLSAVLSAISGALIEKYTGDTFKRISWTVKVWKFDFSFTLFPILTIILKYLLFK
jgi:hypothetical protein